MTALKSKNLTTERGTVMVKNKGIKKNAEQIANEPIEKRNINVFILGDLIIDHTVFVNPKEYAIPLNYPHPVSGETSFRVLKRLDTAGGAATTARTMNSLSDGCTYLWGLVGESPWGSFRSILDNSQALDGSSNRIEFRGAHDETNAPMTTVSRIVAAHNDNDSTRERHERKVRFLDIGKIHVPIERQREAIRYHLERVHKVKVHFDAIILNDLEFGALHNDVVKEVTDFAIKCELPVIIRARKNASKYFDVQARALVCTLPEWQSLVGSKNEVNYWADINKVEIAEEFVRCTLSTFSNLCHCVVLVGDNWIDKVIIIDRPVNPGDVFSLTIADGVPQTLKGKSQQVGASDVFTGAFTFGMCKNGSSPSSFDSAIREALKVVHSYQNTGWNRIPNKEDLKKDTTDEQINFKVVISRRFGTPYLPPDRTIDLGKAKTCIPDVYSVTNEFVQLLDQMQHAIKNDDKSFVLIASGGSGKTKIADQLLKIAQQNELYACNFKDLAIRWDWNNPSGLIKKISSVCKSLSSHKPFIVVDEVLKYKNGINKVKDQGVVLINEANDAGIRFLLIDADFAKLDWDEELKSQFGRRVVRCVLPSAWDRPYDIPYVFASSLLSCLGRRKVNISIEMSALISIIEWMLDGKRNFGDLNNVSSEIVANQKHADDVLVCWDKLPEKIKGQYRPRKDSNETKYTVKFDNNFQN